MGRGLHLDCSECVISIQTNILAFDGFFYCKPRGYPYYLPISQDFYRLTEKLIVPGLIVEKESMKTVTLNCASCGAPVSIPDGAETFVCYPIPSKRWAK
jgi:hypothetical protein